MIRIIYITGLLLLLIALSSVSEGQEVTVTAAFDTSRIFIGDQISFTVSVDQPGDIKLSLPHFKDTLTGKIEILHGPVTDSSGLPDSRIRITQKYLITSFDSGLYRIAPVFAESTDPNQLKRFYSGYSTLEVAKFNVAPSDTTSKIYDIVGPYRAPVTPGEILPWVLIVIVVASLIYLVLKYVKKLKPEKKVVGKVINKDPAHIIAFRELEKLKGEKLWQTGETKKYYTRLTEILRHYLENRYGIFSLELTTTETLAELVSTGFKKDDSFHTLKSVLTGADLVKFAKYNPVASENELSFEQSWNFVTATKKEDQPVKSDGEEVKRKEENL